MHHSNLTQPKANLPKLKCTKCKLLFDVDEGQTFFCYGFYCNDCHAEEKWFATQLAKMRDQKVIESYDDL